MKEAFSEILKEIEEGSFSLIKAVNVQASSEDLVRQIEDATSYGVVNNTEGKVSLVEDKGDVKYWGKNNTPMPFHLDGAYYPKIPRYALLYCVRSSDQGGNTVFAEAAKVIDKLYRKYDANLLESITVIYMGTDRKKYRRPLLEETESGNKFLNWYSSIYIEPDMRKISDENRRLFTRNTSELILDIEKYLEESIVHDQEWKEGDLVVFDNRLLLHSRREMAVGGNRLLYRIWFDTEGFVDVKNPIQD